MTKFSDSEVLIARRIWFQICGDAEDKMAEDTFTAEFSLFSFFEHLEEWPVERSRRLE